MTMNPVTVPAGFAPVYVGWNVWQVWQADDPDESVLGTIWHAGESKDRLLRAWIEDQVQTNAPGVGIADPFNPAALRGDQVQIVTQITGLTQAATRGEIPALAGALQLGTPTSTAALFTVRFFNRGTTSALAWPHDKNFLLENVYLPSDDNPLTNGPAPTSLAGAASGLSSGIANSVTTMAWLIGGAAALLLLSKIRR